MRFSSQLRNPRLALYPLPSRIFEGAQSFTNQAYTCFVYLQKASDPWNIPQGCFGSMGVCGLLLQAICSLRLGLRQGSPFISDSIHIFMDRISPISFLPSSDDVVLLPSADSGIQLALEQFAAKCGAARMGTSKSEATEFQKLDPETPRGLGHK